MNTLAVIFTAMSVKYGLPPGLLHSLCYIESKHNVDAIHYADGDSDSLGVCQIKLSTAKWLGFKGTAEQLMEPKYNIKYAAKYLSYQLKRYGSIEQAVIAYNMGHAAKLTTTRYQARVFEQWRGINEGN